ncbi:MAG: TrkA family potassium uptake protein [Lachnospiraceae bacterium]|nr:TrkA family potassium uptake protein [Lachnospiraceae bacterium]MBQ9233586.1 TrkA family potassium uptake protein [Lachnospiraceae bacterium]MBQ9279095.1 TrkA family potassium uptake protein [Lachnospiraceae bacterium]
MEDVMKKSIAVLGLGKYGRSLVENLYKMGADVLAVDAKEEIVNEISDRCTSAICADLTNEEEVIALGLKNMDIVITAMGRNLAASIMSVAVAKEQGVKLVVSKASTDRMATILTKVGADKILDPEEEGGVRSARILMSSLFRDFFEIDENMYMIEMQPKKEWVGKNLMELELRKNLNLNVLAVKEKGEKWSFVDPKKAFSDTCTILIVMEKKDMKKWKLN